MMMMIMMMMVIRRAYSQFVDYIRCLSRRTRSA